MKPASQSKPERTTRGAGSDTTGSSKRVYSLQKCDYVSRHFRYGPERPSSDNTNFVNSEALPTGDYKDAVFWDVTS
jgi:hypothetical protein